MPLSSHETARLSVIGILQMKTRWGPISESYNDSVNEREILGLWTELNRLAMLAMWATWHSRENIEKYPVISYKIWHPCWVYWHIRIVFHTVMEEVKRHTCSDYHWTKSTTANPNSFQQSLMQNSPRKRVPGSQKLIGTMSQAYPSLLS